MVLCGNKCDLENERQVTKAEAEGTSKGWGCPFYETSALARINVEEAFYDLVREIRKETNVKGNTTKKQKPKGKAGGCQLF